MREEGRWGGWVGGGGGGGGRRLHIFVSNYGGGGRWELEISKSGNVSNEEAKYTYSAHPCILVKKKKKKLKNWYHHFLKEVHYIEILK